MRTQSTTALLGRWKMKKSQISALQAFLLENQDLKPDAYMCWAWYVSKTAHIKQFLDERGKAKLKHHGDEFLVLSSFVIITSPLLSFSLAGK